MNVMAGARAPVFERRFYLVVSAVFVALVFWTFARTYFLKTVYGTPALPLLLHVHGVVMSGWVVLLAVQSSLVAMRRVAWHRRIGWFGTAWAVLVVSMGSITTVHAAARAVRTSSDAAPMLVAIAGLEVMQMIFFAAFVGAAVLLRRRTDYHKRLMLMTVVCMLPSVLSRLPVSFMSNAAILIGLDLFIVIAVGIDTWRHRRLHPAFAWSGGLFLAAFNGGIFFFMSAAWIRFGTSLVS